MDAASLALPENTSTNREHLNTLGRRAFRIDLRRRYLLPLPELDMSAALSRLRDTGIAAAGPAVVETLSARGSLRASRASPTECLTAIGLAA